MCTARATIHPHYLKNIPDNINKRLTSISSSKEVFDAAITPYQKAIDESGYNFKLTYNPEANQTTRNRQNRKRNITWYNPPWEAKVRTNLARKFLGIVDKCFPTSSLIDIHLSSDTHVCLI